MRLGLAGAALIILTPAHATTEVTRAHVCERAGITRVVELQSDRETGLPCHVIYKKPMEDQSATTLWNAQSDIGYCAQKYDAFITKIENKHNWSCTANSSNLSAALAPSNRQRAVPITLTAPTSSSDSNRPAKGTPVEKPAKTDDITPRVKIAITASSTGPAKTTKPTPEISSALPLADRRQASDTKISMALIRQLIPSGQYVVDSKVPHSGNSSLCPTGGYFIWNTKQLTKPFFEMGPDNSFQFDLTELSDEAPLHRSNIVLDKQCHVEVTTGYCSETAYTGSTPLPYPFARHFDCGSNSDKSDRSQPLVLIRSIATKSDSTGICHSSPTPYHMALASTGAFKSSITAENTTGIELAILPYKSKNTKITDQEGAICRYRRS